MSGTAGKILKAIKSIFNKTPNVQESIKIQETTQKLNAVKSNQALATKIDTTSQHQVANESVKEDKTSGNSTKEKVSQEVTHQKVKKETASSVITESTPVNPLTKEEAPIPDPVIAKKPDPPAESTHQTRVFKTIKPHIPLIKFRKGANPASVLSAAPEQGQTETSSIKSDPLKTQVYSLDWWQTPNKYKRRLIDELECDAINSGGGDKLWQ